MTSPGASNPLSFSYRIGFRTDVGQQRSLNEDAGEILDLRGTDAAFVICDGMGGLQAGDRASGEAVRVVREALTEQFAGGVPADIPEALRVALVRANDAVNALHQQSPAANDASDGGDAPTVRREVGGLSSALMGTTCVAGVVSAETLFVAHAGDSRAYLWRGGHLIRLTEDHSYVAERVKAGDITEAEARISRFRNVVTRAIGIDVTVEPDLRTESLQPGDTLLVCSDGLTTMLEDPEIVPILRAQQRASPDRLASLLVDAANKKGGNDNITVLIMRVDGPPGLDPPVLTPMEGDTPSNPAKRSSPAIVVLGVLLVAAVLVGGFFFLQLQKTRQAGELTPQGVASSPLSVDYAKLVYDPPQPFSSLGARGDLLAFSRDGGLYFVRLQSGTITSVGPEGRPLHIDAGTVEVAPATHDVPNTHIFMATDPQGNVYISYTRRKVIEKRSSDGKVLLTLSGFDRPEAISVNEDGDLFVVDYNQIKRLHAHLPSPSPSPKPAATAGGAKPASKG